MHAPCLRSDWSVLDPVSPGTSASLPLQASGESAPATMKSPSTTFVTVLAIAILLRVAGSRTGIATVMPWSWTLFYRKIVRSVPARGGVQSADSRLDSATAHPQGLQVDRTS